MPKIVDWDSKRDEILSATWRVIARDGITGATIRAIAREANCSRGILGHYFTDKADILGSALVLSHRRVGARMSAAAAGLTGLEALRIVMLEALPLDGGRDLEAQIEISFWGRALGNAELRELRDDFDVELATHQLVVLIDGLSAERVLYPDRVSPERQTQMLDRLLHSFAAPARAVPGLSG
jgi:AcrR family transcriptional regulator